MKKRHQFTEKPPSTDDPDWAEKFAAWATRKARHHDMGTFEFMARALGCNKKDAARARALDEKSAPGTPMPNGGFENPFKEGKET